MTPIDLHLVSWKRPKMTELVIETIKRNTELGTYNLRIWDNNSENIGLEAARQKLLENTESEYFVCVDNDCLPPKGWLPQMIDLMERYKDVGAISQRTQVMIGTGDIFEEADKNGDELVEFPHPGGSFRIMRTEAVKAVGGWDRESQGRGSEEKYICGKLREVGFRTAFATQIRCLHLFGTRGDNGTDNWGYDKEMTPEESGHSDISHPALTNGDDPEEVKKFAGEELANAYLYN